LENKQYYLRKASSESLVSGELPVQSGLLCDKSYPYSYIDDNTIDKTKADVTRPDDAGIGDDPPIDDMRK
jgi:hypothetical protein